MEGWLVEGNGRVVRNIRSYANGIGIRFDEMGKKLLLDLQDFIEQIIQLKISDQEAGAAEESDDEADPALADTTEPKPLE